MFWLTDLYAIVSKGYTTASLVCNELFITSYWLAQDRLFPASCGTWLIFCGLQITKISRVVSLTRHHNFQVLAGSTGFLLPALLVGKQTISSSYNYVCLGQIKRLKNTHNYHHTS
jgi:hypothetical protein